MIQRIQSLFLLLAAACAFALFGLPFATVTEPVAATIFSDGVYNIMDHIGTMVLFGLAGALALASIFLFNNRKLQMSLSRFAIIANIIGFILAIVLFFNDKESLGAEDPNDGFGVFLPILFIVFALLALRFIGKDDKLVKSMDRLR